MASEPVLARFEKLIAEKSFSASPLLATWRTQNNCDPVISFQIVKATQKKIDRTSVWGIYFVGMFFFVFVSLLLSGMIGYHSHHIKIFWSCISLLPFWILISCVVMKFFQIKNNQQYSIYEIEYGKIEAFLEWFHHNKDIAPAA